MPPMMTLMAKDEDERRVEEIHSEGLLPGEERWVTHMFSFPLNRGGAMAAYRELGEYPFSVIDEELTGDEYWHIATFRRQAITIETVAHARDEMEAIAERFGGEYDGWDLTYRRRGSLLPPEGDPIFGTYESPIPLP
jgi:Regulator of ribonuclease activity B